MSEFKVGDRVRMIEGGFEGTIEEVVRVDHPHYSYNSGEYSYMYRVADKYKYFHGLDANELELIEKAKEPTTLEDLDQRIEKLEKCVMGEQNSLEKCANVSNFEKMTPKLGIKDFKDMIRPNKIVLNTNDPLEMIWNSTDEEETKPSLLTEDERVILRNLDKKWKWIARDEDRDDLHVYSLEPVKTIYEWNVEGVMNFENFYIFNHLFQFIKWTDKEPYNIEELLKGECEE
jgi:hypothetical protein